MKILLGAFIVFEIVLINYVWHYGQNDNADDGTGLS